MNPNISKLQFYSIGIVAANKKLDTDLIEVVPMETTPMVDGELTDNIEKFEAKSQTPDGQSFNVDMETTASIKAKWLSYTDTNRMTSPDVRRGEMVAIYQFSDTDEYWWMTLQQDKKLRRLETVIYSFSNQREENKEVDSNSAYWFEISTHGKYIHLHTSKNDKEPFVYDIQINTKKGQVIIQDDDNNYIYMDSKERIIKLHNKDTSYVDIDKKVITIHAIDKVHVKTKDFIVDASQKITMTTQAYTLKTSSYKVNANTYNTTVPVANFSANIKAGANINAGANVTAGATVKGAHISGGTYSGGHHS